MFHSFRKHLIWLPYIKYKTAVFQTMHLENSYLLSICYKMGSRVSNSISKNREAVFWQNVPSMLNSHLKQLLQTIPPVVGFLAWCVCWHRKTRKWLVRKQSIEKRLYCCLNIGRLTCQYIRRTYKSIFSAAGNGCPWGYTQQVDPNAQSQQLFNSPALLNPAHLTRWTCARKSYRFQQILSESPELEANGLQHLLSLLQIAATVVKLHSASPTSIVLQSEREVLNGASDFAKMRNGGHSATVVGMLTIITEHNTHSNKAQKYLFMSCLIVSTIMLKGSNERGQDRVGNLQCVGWFGRRFKWSWWTTEKTRQCHKFLFLFACCEKIFMFLQFLPWSFIGADCDISRFYLDS